MAITSFVRRLALGFALAVAPTVVSAEPFSQLIVFSGALSDTGNMAAEKGDYPAPFYKNRNSNGLVAVDVLANRLGLSSDASLHLVGKQEGTNFAVGDALAGGTGPHDLPAQVKAYLDRDGGKADPKALYFLFIGGNDVVLAAQTMDEKQALKILDDAVAGIETAMQTLLAAGAKTIFAPDFIDIGLSPAVTKYGPEAAKRSSWLSDLYNEKFEAMLDRMEGKEFELVRWSFGDFVKSVMAHSDEFGFTNVKDACVEMEPKSACDPEKFVFFTEVYPTAKVHELVGSAMAIALLERDKQAATRPAD